MTLRLLAVLSLAGCTTMGPMPATTLVPPVPAGNPSVEVGAAVAPGFFLSEGTQREPHGSAMPQLSALFEPDRMLGVPGLFAGLRVAMGGADSGTAAEPMLGYRRTLGDRLAAGLVGFGTHASATQRDAHLTATRIGVEIAADLRVTPVSRWLELHGVLSATLTGIIADGNYCLDGDGYGADCPQEPDPPGTMIDGSASGMYPTVSAGAALAFGNHLAGVFHGARLTLHVAGGTMPAVRYGVQQEAQGYASAGLSLSLGIGAGAKD